MPTLILGSNRVPATLEYRDDIIAVKFGFNEPIKNEIKAMEGARWNPAEKAWTVKNNQRNNFALDYLLGKNVFERYDLPLVEWKPKRDVLMGHQKLMARHILTRRQCYVAADPGTGKTLTAIEVTEAVNPKNCWFVSPRVALLSVKLEFAKWKAGYFPRFMTYEELVKLMLNWTGGDAPQMVWFDEGHKLKTPTAKRTQAALHLANSIRERWGDDGYVTVMSGTPAPKSPLDYWSQIEVARPGFIREGTPDKFMDRIALRKRVEGDSGVAYPKLITFYDDVRKCRLCGRLADHPLHSPEAEFIISGTDEKPHQFVASVDEVSKMVKRLDGIMLRVNKNECFGGDTLILTKQGVKRIGDLAGKKVEVLSRTETGMGWVESSIKSYGVRETKLLKFGDHNLVWTTPGHRWLTEYKYKDSVRVKVKATSQLKNGKDQLPYANVELPEPNQEAQAHGFVYGDGTRVETPAGYRDARVGLYGPKEDLLPLLLKFGYYAETSTKSKYGRVPYIRNLPYSWKDLPENPSQSYALGFVLGLTEADGWVGHQCKVYQECDIALESIRQIAMYAGLRCSPIYDASTTDNKKPGAKLWVFSYQNVGLKREWFQRKDNQRDFQVRNRQSYTTPTVYDVTKTQEVFCAVVPKYENFTLANGVITGNCMDLPEFVYRKIVLKPSKQTLAYAKMLAKTGGGAAQVLILHRELSDGFQYHEKLIGTRECEACKGTGTRPRLVAEETVDELVCLHCAGKGHFKEYETSTIETPTPKDQALLDFLEEKEDDGRLITFGAFQGTIDKICRLTLKAGWDFICRDGRGWKTSLGNQYTDADFIKMFQREMPCPKEKINFIGHPRSVSMGLTLTASDTIFWYSNSFDAEDRMQGCNRIHRPGTRGAIMVDLIHLPVDQLILDNLQKKQDMQSITLGDIEKVLDAEEGT